MDLSRLKKKFLFYLSVPKCVHCKERLDFENRALCYKCELAFEEIKTRNCSKCSKLLSECFCTSEYLHSHFVKGVAKCFRYNVREDSNPANSLIFSLKRENRSDVLERCTAELVTALNHSLNIDESFVITNVPRRRKSIVRYGIDQSELLAKSLASWYGIPYKKLLCSNAKREQKLLSHDERLKNADFRIIDETSLGGKNVILVDDIITTGASMAGASAMIRTLFPKNIFAASLAIAYRDDM